MKNRKWQKHLCMWLSFILLVGLLSGLPAASAATTPFTDDFEGMMVFTVPSSAPGNARGWQSNTGTNNPWSVAKDETSNYVMKATNTTAGSTFTLFNNSSMSSAGMIHTAKMKISNTAVRTGITARYLDGNNYYAVTLNKSGSNSLFEIRKKTSSSTTTVASAPFAYDTSTYYTLTIATVTSGSDVTVIGTIKGGPTLVYTDTAGQPSPGSKFGFYIAGVASENQTAYFDDVYATDNLIQAPTNVTASPGDGKVALNWPASAEATSYTVKRYVPCTGGCASGQAGYYTTIAANVMSTSYVDKGLTNGTPYAYAISAVKGTDDGLLSSQVSAIPQAEDTSEPSLASVALSGLTTTLNVNATSQAVVKAVYSDSSSYYVTNGVMFNSSAPSVAAISATGLVTAKAPGMTVITATYKGITSPGFPLTVNDSGPTLNSVSVTGPSVLDVGGVGQFSATAIYSDSTTQNVTASATFASSSEGVISFGPNGSASALNAGSTLVTATYQGVKSSGLNVTVNPASGQPLLIGSADDTYVESSKGNSPQGSLNNMKVKLNSLVEFRNAYLKFIMPQYEGILDKVNLNLYFALDSNTASYVVELQGIEEDNWSEQTLTYNQQPGTLNGVYANAPGEKGTVIGQYTIDQSGSYSFDVTDFVKNQYDNLISFRIIGVTNNKGSSVFSKEAADATKRPSLTIMTRPDTGEPRAPINLSAGGKSSTSVHLSWSPADDRADGYYIKRGTENGGPYVNIGTSLSASFTDNGLEPGTTYYYVVSGYNDKGESHASLQVAALTIPAAPASVAATAGDRQIALTWEPSDGASSYNIYRMANGQTSKIASSVTATVYTDIGLVNGSSYHYTVTSVNESGESEASISVATSAVVPLVIGKPTMRNANKATVTNLQNSGYVEVGLTIQNKSSQNVTGSVVIGLYNSNDTAAYENRIIAKFLKGDQNITVYSAFDLPSDISGYTVKAMITDATDSNQPLSNQVTIP
ncbi:fibronectin type III domain-containing protein [Paenibacillus radicis (ex Xue et al. 2023)]|uniref:DNRLRE domain-containing protein n=1 Tax=Paenibacillus radicis (ex Xue et al. 2023) TaxID=2972489 RepID=A0ABT1YTX2_9BACL|nr:DNRLRE domain-containing protein [Paenibacillus radicis (ex Xue et al. 2023)]MCR8636641.1 DNRLRE domain-containing protein [Paenibacillus radicis (ex Xue et al. 2023)]